MNFEFNNGKIYCTKCRTPNKAGYRFCVKCGTKLMTPVPRPKEEDVKDVPKAEPVKAEPDPVKAEPEQPMFSSFEQAEHVAEPEKAEPQSAMAEPEPEEPTFSAFEQAAPVEEPVEVRPEPEEPTFSAFEQAAQVEEPFEAGPEPEMPEIQPSFGAFEQSAPVEEPFEVEPEPEEPTFSAFEAEPKRDYAGFARSGFTGTTTPSAAAGAFATAVDAVKNNKQIDVSDAETVMSLLEQGESSALAKGLPAWDIVPPQVVVRRKHRV